MKKLFALLLVIALAFSLCIPALAEGDSTTDGGTITIVNATIGKEYKAYKIFDASYVETEDEITAAAYTIKTTSPFFGAVDESGLFDMTPTAGDNTTYVVTLINGKTNAEVLEWLSGLKSTTTNPDYTTTATNNTVAFNNVPYGYYLITTNNGAFVTVDNVNKNVNIIDKNQAPGWDDPDDPEGGQQPGKNVSDSANGPFAPTSTAAVGDTVYFKINAYAPLFHNDKLVTLYTFTDTLDSAFTYNNDLVIKANGTVLNASAYTVSTEGINGFKVTLEVDGKAWAVETYLEFTYSARLNMGATPDNKNTASMTWNEVEPDPDNPAQPKEEDPDNPYGPETDDPPTDVETHTYTFGFDLTKTDGTDDNMLDGAEFDLYDAASAGNKIQLVDVTATTDNPIEGVKYYRVADSTVTTEEYPVIEAGRAIVFGLDEGTYYLEEIAAPAGYNMLTERYPVYVGVVDVDDEYITYTEVTVQNNTGTILPETGGIGTTVFYVVGGALVLGAAVLLITKKRLSKQN